ncbi:MAG: UvrD-helicase domain-containing protein [Gemmatimonadaceae bacterium]
MVSALRRTPFDGEPPLTAEQLAAVVREGHTILEAGAGSGKTTTLVDKIIYSLGADRAPGHSPTRRCELSEIAAITFTNAAAADFKRKLRERMRLIADFHMRAGAAAEERRWRNRIYEVDRARVGTIHSFCGQLLREFSLRVGLDPAFQIADEGEGKRLAGEAAASALNAALREERESAFELAERLGLRESERLIAQIVSSGSMATDALGAWAIDGSPRLVELQHGIESQRAGWGCQDEIGTWKADVDPDAARMACTLLSLATDARAALDAQLVQDGVLDFDALILRTRSLLSGRPDVLRAIQKRLKWLFIDEFQDTDADQLEIAYRICGIDTGGSTGASQDLPWLCIVGDPKQSIYRFRRADVSLWKTVSGMMAARGAEPIILNTNFRSRSPILGFVNATFDGLIGEGREGVIAAGHEVPYVKLLAHRRAAVAEEHFELLAIPGGGKADEQRAVEAEMVGARIREMVDSAAGGLETDGTGATRRIRYSDIAILFRARTALPAYEMVFRKLGIPYYIAGGAGLFGRREIRDVRLLLTALTDEHDDLAWIGVLRSPFVGLTDQALYRFRTGHPAEPFSAMLELAGAEQDPHALLASSWIDAARQLRDRMPVASLIDHLLGASGYAAQLLAEPGGEQSLANLRKLVRIAEGRPDSSVAEFLSFMDEREEGDARDGDAALYTAGEDVVTLSTVHAAKGLEWRVVFLADLERDIVSTTKMSSIYADPIAGIALKCSGTGENEESLIAGAFECLRQRDIALSEAEEKRLWYVATTRAKDRLILCAGAQKCEDARAQLATEAGATKVLHWLLRSLVPEDDYHTYSYAGERWSVGETIVTPETLPSASPRSLPTIEQVSAARLPADVEAALTARLAPVSAGMSLPARSATQLQLLNQDAVAYRERYLLGLAERRAYSATSEHAAGSSSMGVPATVLGVVLHGALERDREDDDLDEYLERELCAQIGDDAASPRVTTAVLMLRQMIDATRAHPSVARMCDAALSERELAFTWFARSADRVTMMRGAMDLVAQIDGHLEVLDYKSHGRAEGREREIGDAYLVQRDVYSTVISALTGEAPTRFSFFFPTSGGEAAYTPDPAEMERSFARLHALLDAAHALHAT